MKSRWIKLQRILKDPLRKSLLKIVLEFSKECVSQKRIVQEYFSRLCYRKNYPSLHNYVKDKDIGKLQTSRILHSDQSAETLINKVSFYRFCKKHQIPTPEVLAYSKDKELFSIGDQKLDDGYESFKTTLYEWIDKSKHQSIFIKPVDAKGGVGAYKLNKEKLHDEVYVKSVYHSIINKNYIIQETILQHPDIAKINPDAINTVRIDTYQPINEPSRVLSALMRFGRNGSVVDNPGSSSGFFIPLDLTTHQLKAPGLQLSVVGNHTYTKHPDTNIELDKHHVPYVNEIVSLVNRACMALEDRLVGWDVCVGVDGPIIIEGNHNYHVLMQEVAYGGYKNHPEFINVLKEENIH